MFFRFSSFFFRNSFKTPPPLLGGREGVIPKKEEADTYNRDNGSNDSAPGNLLVEKPIRREQDYDGRHCHQSGCDACGCVLNSHQRKAYTHEGAKDSCSCSYGQAFLIGKTERRETSPRPPPREGAFFLRRLNNKEKPMTPAMQR